ncbi:MAG: peptide-methionine (S)-S-oxide reductase [Gammaproteobacteria bacterium]|nr:peptide-methionine (S)-S-oxide reductase [Gammaproteobacteria bacterium]
MQIIYDSTKVSYDRLLTTYWHNVDPLDDGGQSQPSSWFTPGSPSTPRASVDWPRPQKNRSPSASAHPL